MYSYCSKCGTQHLAGTSTCMTCGAIIPSVGTSPTPPPPTYMPQNPYVPSGMPPYGAYPLVPMEGPASGRSIACMILGLGSFILGMGPFLSLPGFILGRMELNAIRRGEAPRAGEAYAKVGYYTSLVNLILFGIILLLFFTCLALLMAG